MCPTRGEISLYARPVDGGAKFYGVYAHMRFSCNPYSFKSRNSGK